MSLIEALKWRYAVKKMSGEPVEQSKIDQIVEAAHLAPTSSGLQPFEVIMVTNNELKQKIQPIAYGHSQIVAASHVMIFAAWDKYTEDRIDGYFAHQNELRGLPADAGTDYKNQLKATYANLSDEMNFHHAAKQAYISFGMALAQAAELNVDSTPMEGFNPDQLDELLNLKEKGLRSVLLIAFGNRATEGDWLQGMKKVRKPMDEFLTEIK